MAYKTIMVTLNEVDRVESLLDFATETADYQNAHIIGLYVIPAIQVYPSVAIDLSPQIFEAYRNFFKRHAHQVKETFETRMRRTGLAFEWCLIHGETPLVADLGHRAWHGRGPHHCQPGGQRRKLRCRA